MYRQTVSGTKWSMARPWRARSLISVLLMSVIGPVSVTALLTEPAATLSKGRPVELLVARPGDADYRRSPQYIHRASPHMEFGEGIKPGDEEERASGSFLAQPL